MHNIEFSGIITKNHKLHIDEPKIFQNWLVSKFKEEDRVTIQIKKKRNRRSQGETGRGNQNGYYHGVVIPILCDYFGYTPEEMHEALKYKFNRLPEIEYEGLPKIMSTASLNTVEFEEYMSKIRSWASADHGIYIPQPNEN
jgi:hypothetical protein